MPVSPPASTPWALVTLSLVPRATEPQASRRERHLWDELAGLLACVPEVGGCETRDSSSLEAPATPQLLIYTTPGALADVEERARALAAQLDLGVEVGAEVRHDDDWRDTWKQFYRPIVLGAGALLLRPSWIPRRPDDPAREVVLDPGRAFGTGLHETTRLCLDQMCTLAAQSGSVGCALDLGCGSGILALCAKRLFPSAAVIAIDEDPEATATTQENADINGITEGFSILTGDVDRIEPRARFDLVVANIRAHTLIPRAAAVARHCLPGAHVILSGILSDEADDVEQAWITAGFVRNPEIAPWPRAMGQWVAIDLRWPGPG